LRNVFDHLLNHLRRNRTRKNTWNVVLRRMRKICDGKRRKRICGRNGVLMKKKSVLILISISRISTRVYPHYDQQRQAFRQCENRDRRGRRESGEKGEN